MKKIHIFTAFAVLLIGGNQVVKSNSIGAKNISSNPKEIPTAVLTQMAERSFNFDNDEIGKIPSGWTGYFTGKGKSGRWEIINDYDNRVLAQTSKENFGYHFDVIVNDQLSYTDLELTLKFKGVEGDEDQGGGPVWRFQDATNYYVARANPLENNYRVYKVIDGNRIMLKSIDIEVNTGQWYDIKIIMKGNNIECHLDGRLLLSTLDSSFPRAGKIGVWTKADAVTYFDNLKIAPFNSTVEE